MDLIFPSLANTACLTLPWTYGNIHGATRLAYWQFNFITSGDFLPTYTKLDFQLAFPAWLNPAINTFWPIGFGSGSSARWYINTPTHRQVTSGYDPLPGNTNWHMPRSQCIPIFLHTDTHTKRGQGRVMFAFTRPEDFEGSRVASTFAAHISGLVSFYTTPQTLGGVTFTPAVWSRADNVMRPITKVKIASQASWLTKRQPKSRKQYQPIIIPDVW